MLPIDFIEYVKKFEVGFLGTIGEDGPDIELVHFDAGEKGFEIKGSRATEGRACLALSNEKYVWASENAAINGILEKIEEDGLILVPKKAVWTLGFEIGKWPERIVRRWEKKN